jgi:tetratricopeptide (TPR) repeat protein
MSRLFQRFARRRTRHQDTTAYPGSSQAQSVDNELGQSVRIPDPPPNPTQAHRNLSPATNIPHVHSPITTAPTASGVLETPQPTVTRQPPTVPTISGANTLSQPSPLLGPPWTEFIAPVNILTSGDSIHNRNSTTTANTSPAAPRLPLSPASSAAPPTVSNQQTPLLGITQPAQSSQTPSSHEMNSTAQFLKDEGNRLYREGDINRAIQYYSRALTQAPNNPTLLCNRAAAYMTTSPPDWQKVYDDAKAATLGDPTLWKGWYRLGFSSLNLDKPRESLDQFKRSEMEFKRERGNDASLDAHIREGLEKAGRKVEELDAEERRRRDQEDRRRTEAAQPRLRGVGSTTSGPSMLSTGPGTSISEINNQESAASTSSSTRGIASVLVGAMDSLNLDAPPQYTPNLSHSDPTIRVLSQQQLMDLVNEFELQIYQRSTGAIRIEADLDTELYRRISVSYAGMTTGELTQREYG